MSFYRGFRRVTENEWGMTTAFVCCDYGEWTVHLASGGRLLEKSFPTFWQAIDAYWEILAI